MNSACAHETVGADAAACVVARRKLRIHAVRVLRAHLRRPQLRPPRRSAGAQCRQDRRIVAVAEGVVEAGRGDVLREAHAVVLAGGTMQPFGDLRQQLFFEAAKAAPERLRFASFGHIVPPANLLPLVVGTGPAGRPLQFAFANRGAEPLIDELGEVRPRPDPPRCSRLRCSRDPAVRLCVPRLLPAGSCC